VGSYCRSCHHRYKGELRRIKQATKERAFWQRLTPKWQELSPRYVAWLKAKTRKLAAARDLGSLADDAAQFAHIWAAQFGPKKTNPLYVLTEFLRLELGESGSAKRKAAFNMIDFDGWRATVEKPRARITND
jgi:hypothetical protein